MLKKHYQRTRMSNSKRLKLLLILPAFIIFASPVKSGTRSGNNTTITDSVSVKKRRLKTLEFPVPPANSKMLFYVQRDPNINTLIYELNIDKESGRLNTEEPIHPYWIRYTDKGQIEELNYIQRKFAYGLVQKQAGLDKYDIRFVSYKKFPLTLMKATDGKYHIFATVAQKQMALDYIYIKIEGGSFWLPNVVYVEMRGTDPATGKEITERFKP
jgi:hypothetical protein